jgi:hypothetical protein
MRLTSADEPSRTLALREDTTPSKDRGLSLRCCLDVVVCRPDPQTLEVAGARGGEMETHEGGEAGGVVRAGRALGALQVRARSTAETDVRVPHAGGTLGRALDVPLHDNGAGSGAASREPKGKRNQFSGSAQSRERHVTHMMSVISAVPVWPAEPTLTTTWGLLWLWKLEPPPRMTGQTSPTRREPGGTVSVLVT